MIKRKIGKRIIQLSFFLWLIDISTKFVSTAIGKIICGDDYLCPVDGIVCDRSCGFNTDMHVSSVLIVLFIFGVLLLISSQKGSIEINDNDEANE
jgi:hypothetical protein